MYFIHLEINRVRNDIFYPSNFLMSLPKPQGNIVKLTEKVYAKVKEYPKVNLNIFSKKYVLSLMAFVQKSKLNIFHFYFILDLLFFGNM